jgi:hypothetical protein
MQEHFQALLNLAVDSGAKVNIQRRAHKYTLSYEGVFIQVICESLVPLKERLAAHPYAKTQTGSVLHLRRGETWMWCGIFSSGGEILPPGTEGRVCRVCTKLHRAFELYGKVPTVRFR